MSGPLRALTIALCAVAAGGFAQSLNAEPGASPGFQLGHARVTPEHPYFAGKRKIRLHYRFTASRPIDLRIEVVRTKTGATVASWRERGARPDTKLQRAWNGIDESGRAVPDGRYGFRVGPAGGRDVTAGSFPLRGHVFPVAGTHGTRGAIGEWHAPRSGGRIHEGFDITGACGTALVAARGGVLKQAGFDPVLYGNFALIDATKSKQDYFYAHMIAPAEAGEGQRVFTGEQLGRIGQTGNAASTPCHLHFEIRVGDEPIDPTSALTRWDR